MSNERYPCSSNSRGQGEVRQPEPIFLTEQIKTGKFEIYRAAALKSHISASILATEGGEYTSSDGKNIPVSEGYVAVKIEAGRPDQFSDFWKAVDELTPKEG